MTNFLFLVGFEEIKIRKIQCNQQKKNNNFLNSFFQAQNFFLRSVNNFIFTFK